MKVWTMLFILMTAPCFGQTYSEKELRKIFKEIIKTDQSNLKNPEKRATIFVVNFERIQSLLAESVVLSPQASYSKRTHKIIAQGLNATSIHILQSAPDRLLNKEKINFYSSCIAKGLLSKSSLKTALHIFQVDSDLNRSEPWSLQLAKMFAYAKSEWQINIE